MVMMNHFLLMVAKQYRSSDFDADHPTCSWFINNYKMDQQQGLWFTILTMAFYNEVSAWVAFNRSDPFQVPKDCKLPIDKNRRNLYGSGIIRHLSEVCDQYVQGWPCDKFVGDPKRDWVHLKQQLASVWGNGRFAVYNTADMVQKVNNVPVEITDFENHGSSGPADGICRIGGCDRKDVIALNQCGETIYRRVIQSKLQPKYTKSDRGTVESVLCNFSGMCRGRYYPGRNIDRQQGRIIQLEHLGYSKLVRPFWEAREAVFIKSQLGEYNNWVGVNKERLKTYISTGKVLCPEVER